MLEKTPSVYFAFEDTAQRTQLSSGRLFELSCTHQKQQSSTHHKHKHMGVGLPNFQQVPFDLNHLSLPSPLKSKLKTQQFFQQFDNNFFVTFDGSSPLKSHQKEPESQISTIADPFKQEPSCEDPQTVQLSLLPQGKKSEEQLRGQKWCTEVQLKGSPLPAFEVKKRTAFKSKANIQQNPCLQTHKRIYNKDTFQVFSQPKSQQPTSKGLKRCILTLRDYHTAQVSHLWERKGKTRSTIFQREDKEPILKATTLDSWKMRFYPRRQSLDKTVKRHNIFIGLPWA